MVKKEEVGGERPGKIAALVTTTEASSDAQHDTGERNMQLKR
jgi:hypothetical protein